MINAGLGVIVVVWMFWLLEFVWVITGCVGIAMFGFVRMFIGWMSQ